MPTFSSIERARGGPKIPKRNQHHPGPFNGGFPRAPGTEHFLHFLGFAVVFFTLDVLLGCVARDSMPSSIFITAHMFYPMGMLMRWTVWDSSFSFGLLLITWIADGVTGNTACRRSFLESRSSSGHRFRSYIAKQSNAKQINAMQSHAKQYKAKQCKGKQYKCDAK